ncbi:MAG: hypothetical protein JXA90_06370, partial [Planctomycetes bacterium]|nr:hypothetical protein [Planctomycetota bacterium]
GVIDFFNHSIVRFLLILVGCLGFLLEIKMLGAFLPSLVGFGCFLTIFISSLFPVTGSAVPTGTLLDLVLFCIGIALLAVELLLLPGVAIFALGGSSLCAVSLVFAMVPPDPTALESQMNVQEAITLLIVGFGSGSIIFSALLAFLPKSTLMARRGIISRTTISAVATAESPEEAEAKRAGLVGQRGVAETVLRPAGSVLLDDGRVIDVVTEGGLIEKGTRIIVIGRSGPRTIVAPEPAEGGGAGGGGAKR